MVYTVIYTTWPKNLQATDQRSVRGMSQRCSPRPEGRAGKNCPVSSARCCGTPRRLGFRGAGSGALLWICASLLARNINMVIPLLEFMRLEWNMKIYFYHLDNIKVLQSITLDSCDEKRYNRATKYI